MTDEINDPLSKREILGTAAKFYDPMGLLSPITVPFKCMFQELCQIKADWDLPVPENLSKRWNELISDMKQTERIDIPRCLIPQNQQIISSELHGFADASQTAYGANIYLMHQSK